MDKRIATWGIQPDWTLFLDRDGVINRKIEAGYVHSWEEFDFLPGVLAAIKEFSKYFGRIVVVTNQQGIGKKLMLEEELHYIFECLNRRVEDKGGKIDGYYYCPHLEGLNCRCRKPNTGMGLQVQSDFPEINFEKSVMVGDSISDMRFGRKLDMKTVFITPKVDSTYHAEIMDIRLESLKDFADLFSNS